MGLIEELLGKLIATGIHYDAGAFMTNDSTLKKVIETKVLVLDDFSK